VLKIKATPISVGATAVYPYSDGLAASLAFMSRYGDPVQMWRRKGDSIHVPRALADLSGLPAENDHRTHGQELTYIEPALKARNADQQQVLDNSLGYLKAGIDHIVEAPTGFGKTFIGVSLGLKINRPTLIVVTKEDLVHAWRKTLLNPPNAPKEPGMGLSVTEIGHLQAGVENWKGKRFVIGMIHSLIRLDKYPSEMWQYFGLGIFDEVHRLGADTFQEVCHLLPARLRLGLSATPDRKDGKDRVFHSHIGPVLVKGTTIPMKPRVLLKQTNWRIPDGVKYTPGQMGLVLSIMAKSTTRNKLIVEFAVQAYNKNRTVVIMSDLVENHLKPLFHMLCEAGVSGADIGFYIGQNTADKHKAKLALDQAKSKRVILATYGMTKEGTDVPEWDTLVLATPKADVKQAIGRVMRSMDGKAEPVILDLVDGSKIFQGYALDRMKQYFSVGGTVVRL
jgi:superfamily II DNA or RNA helicase